MFCGQGENLYDLLEFMRVFGDALHKKRKIKSPRTILCNKKSTCGPLTAISQTLVYSY